MFLIQVLNRSLLLLVFGIRFNFDDESDEDSEVSEEDSPVASNPAVKSNFEQRQERLAAKIRDMEDEAVAPKPWQLMGETKAELRPENALLEEDLFFDHTTREAPVITEETTRTLEEIIRQRIKDKAFDDVERKIKPVYDPTEYKKKLVLDQEKSKFSLAEIYEQVGKLLYVLELIEFFLNSFHFFKFSGVFEAAGNAGETTRKQREQPGWPISGQADRRSDSNENHENDAKSLY